MKTAQDFLKIYEDTHKNASQKEINAFCIGFLSGLEASQEADREVSETRRVLVNGVQTDVTKYIFATIGRERRPDKKGGELV
jgi:hypothetical protein